jgi:hypothetical protein
MAFDGDLLGDLTPETELAAVLKKSPRTLARWRRARVGPPFVMIGRDPYYSKKSFCQWLADREVDCSSKRRKR